MSHNNTIVMSGRSRFPFTASQWQELEHQALIFNYMVSGIPIPTDLLFTIERSCCFYGSRHPLKLFPHQHQHQHQQTGWNCFQFGLGRKIDPEPGRCRRTDGKKWRCSKEAYPDSKYCERHMHRGKNRSRKPVEPLITTTTSSSSSTTATMKLSPPLFYSATKHQDSFSLNSTHMFLDSTSTTASGSQRRSRCLNGLKEEVDDQAFFFEPSMKLRALSSVSSMDDSFQLTPLSMSCSSSSSSSSSKQRSCDYSYLQLQSLADQIHTPKRKDLVHAESKSEGPQKTVHRFIDEWPPSSRASWLHLDDKSSETASPSTTSLSISIPSAHDSPIFSSGAPRS